MIDWLQESAEGGYVPFGVILDMRQDYKHWREFTAFYKVTILDYVHILCVKIPNPTLYESTTLLKRHQIWLESLSEIIKEASKKCTYFIIIFYILHTLMHIQSSINKSMMAFMAVLDREVNGKDDLCRIFFFFKMFPKSKTRAANVPS